MLRNFLVTAILVLCPSISLFSQTSTRENAAASLEQWRVSRMRTLIDDWGDLGRYREVNEKLKSTGERGGVVFLGDSITDGWDLGKYFPGHDYINRGISGQTTPQMLVRFRQDVIELHPSVVVLLAGTNDIAGNTGPMRLSDIEANYASMAELAHGHGIRVVLCSVMPVHNYTEPSNGFFPLRPMAEIRELNRFLQSYAKRNRFVYLDYFTPMLDANGFLKRELSEDGLHPNERGYELMSKLAQRALDSLQKKSRGAHRGSGPN